MKFNKKCKSLHLGRSNLRLLQCVLNQYALGTTQVESSFAEKDLGVLVVTKLNVSQ